MDTVILASNDDRRFTVKLEVAVQSKTIKNMLKTRSIKINPKTKKWEVPVIPLPHINGRILAKVIEWCKQHVNDLPIEDDHEEDDDEYEHPFHMSDWDEEFFELDQDTFFDIISAAYYLDVQSLLDSSCQTIAKIIENKTSREIREYFRLNHY